jgi:Bacterial fructose-1,6-bisphosphatase, glpX-encoded
MPHSAHDDPPVHVVGEAAHRWLGAVGTSGSADTVLRLQRVPETNVDLMVGIGGTPEGVLAACALKCLGGAFYGRLHPRNDDERRRARDVGYDVEKVLTLDDMVGSDNVFVAATGVTDGEPRSRWSRRTYTVQGSGPHSSTSSSRARDRGQSSSSPKRWRS